MAAAHVLGGPCMRVEAPASRLPALQLRVIVPGHVGARQVKWLSRIILSERESQARRRGCFWTGWAAAACAWLALLWQCLLAQYLPATRYMQIASMGCCPWRLLQAPWQQRDYRLLPQSVVDHEGAESEHGWASMPSVQVMPVQVGRPGPAGCALSIGGTGGAILFPSLVFSGGSGPRHAGLGCPRVTSRSASWLPAAGPICSISYESSTSLLRVPTKQCTHHSSCLRSVPSAAAARLQQHLHPSSRAPSSLLRPAPSSRQPPPPPSEPGAMRGAVAGSPLPVLMCPLTMAQAGLWLASCSRRAG